MKFCNDHREKLFNWVCFNALKHFFTQYLTCLDCGSGLFFSFLLQLRFFPGWKMMLIFGHFSWGDFTTDSGGERDCIDFEGHEASGVELGCGSEEHSKSDFVWDGFELGVDAVWIGDSSSKTFQYSSMSFAFSPDCKTHHHYYHHHL